MKESCCGEGICPKVYYARLKEPMKAGKERPSWSENASNLAGDTMLPPSASASRRQVGHTILSLKLPLYLTHDHSLIG